MTQANERWGSDLRLLVNLERQNDRDRAHDLAIAQRDATNIDLQLIHQEENLKQALLLRFLTPVGEMAALGHDDYGSRLFELIGELNNDTTRNRAKLYVLQALAMEPRVQEVRSVRVTPGRSDRTQMDIEISLVAIDRDTVLNLVFPFFLE